MYHVLISILVWLISVKGALGHVCKIRSSGSPVTYSALSHALDQSWLIVNWALWNKLLWQFNQVSSAKFMRICPSINCMERLGSQNIGAYNPFTQFQATGCADINLTATTIMNILFSSDVSWTTHKFISLRSGNPYTTLKILNSKKKIAVLTMPESKWEKCHAVRSNLSFRVIFAMNITVYRVQVAPFITNKINLYHMPNRYIAVKYQTEFHSVNHNDKWKMDVKLLK